MDEVLDVQAEKLAITRRIAGDIKDIWALQPRFEQRSGKRPYGVLQQPRFKAGYDFLLLRVESGEVDPAVGEWWTAFLACQRRGTRRHAAAGSSRRSKKTSPAASPAGRQRAGCHAPGIKRCPPAKSPWLALPQWEKRP
jgi:poly(A) polymerase